MRRPIIAIALALVSSTHAGEFNRPWDDASVALVIDPYHGFSIDWDKLSEEPRLVAIIHKATIGCRGLDPKYVSRKMEAKRRGYLWGSYHWGVAGDPEKQADCYIDTVKPTDDELIALDLEDGTSCTRLMSAEEALRFIKRIKTRIGRYPLIYTNDATTRLLSAKYKNTELAQLPLWYARFKGVVTDFPSGLWPTYTLWQFSSEILSQKAIPGTKSDMNIDVYNGTVDELKAHWPLTKKAP
jgi:GH25 family lysozyme M1 (1,4-beta-N-acetylmuramidase)